MDQNTGDLSIGGIIAKVVQQDLVGALNSLTAIPHLFDFKWYTLDIWSLGFLLSATAMIITLITARAQQPQDYRANSIASHVEEGALAVLLILAAYAFTFLINGEQPINFVGRSSRVNVCRDFWPCNTRRRSFPRHREEHDAITANGTSFSDCAAVAHSDVHAAFGSQSNQNPQATMQ